VLVSFGTVVWHHCFRTHECTIRRIRGSWHVEASQAGQTVMNRSRSVYSWNGRIGRNSRTRFVQRVPTTSLRPTEGRRVHSREFFWVFCKWNPCVVVYAWLTGYIWVVIWLTCLLQRRETVSGITRGWIHETLQCRDVVKKSISLFGPLRLRSQFSTKFKN